MTQAYEWVCQARLDYSAHSDIWDLRFHWVSILPRLQQQLLEGTFKFSPQIQYRFPEETKTVWAAIDALVLKCIALVLTAYLNPHLNKRCFSIKGHGGLKEAVRQTKDHLSQYKHFYRSDVLSYYASIRHDVLLTQLTLLIPDARVIELIAKSLDRVETSGGEYYDITCGISKGSPLSPLLGAIALKPLDDALEKLSLFYCRYVDDWCFLASTKRQLRKAIKIMHRILNTLHFKTHPDKTFIGKTEKGFSFLGYQIHNIGLGIAQQSIENYQVRRQRLQEQQATQKRLVEYSKRWLSWFKAGVALWGPVEVEIRNWLGVAVIKNKSLLPPLLSITPL